MKEITKVFFHFTSFLEVETSLGHNSLTYYPWEGKKSTLNGDVTLK